ncbi:phosphatase PAP2 family protein [Pelomonas sp. UHG3]|uniref:Phosphatase PAP2 family protein n=1 Tax=Roseateles hydrophilus TaxID=2975054 RepID=A0ACC6CBK4_9BURK|nr:phosphatase PAP2 family protein [Pelomonas sp. UHG3]MCY4745813.1 phosphatase PAP2 family protein [Pelomonas sp. UHG3]
MSARNTARRPLGLALIFFIGFGLLGLAMHHGATAGWDQAALQLAQQWRAAHPAVTRAMLDASSLGGTPVLTLFTLLAAGYLLSVGRPARAAAVAAAMVSGVLALDGLKAVFERARPDPAFAALVQDGLSFPSGHASMSAVFYLTLGVLLAQRHGRRAERLYLLAVATLLAALIGTSRVVLGVHWASDVLAGWAFGVGWAALWFSLAARLRDARGPG